jgi:mediator of RNA polymerase II transcription subunit 7
MDEDFPELQHPLPAPPAHFANYTDHNLALLALIRQRVPPLESFQSSVPSTSDSSVQDPKEASPSLPPRLPPPLPPIDLQTQIDLLKDETDVPSWPLTDLDPPRVDWILEDDGIFTVFGQTLKVRLFPIVVHQRYRSKI